MIVFITIIGFVSCTNRSSKIAYQCPMECQKDTAYSKSGKCPICEMELIELNQFDSTKITILNNQNK